MAVIANGNELTLSGIVGADLFEEAFTHADVVRALAAFPADAELTIRLNSPGGAADEGLAIHNALRVRAGRVVAIIDGVAASAASVIALGADQVIMHPGALFMIHEPGISMFGATSADLETARAMQSSYTAAYAEIYARKTGKPEAEIREMMRAETWFTAQEALGAGFADQIDGAAVDIVERAPAFAYQVYAHAPQRLVALAAAREWKLPDQINPERKETAMSENKVTVAEHSSATARIKAIMQSPEAEGRDKLAEHLAFDTMLTAQAATAIMEAAPSGDKEGEFSMSAYEAARVGTAHIAGAGLGGQPSRPESGLVTAMKRRHSDH